MIIIIGKPAKDIPEAEALDYVLGYTAGNNVSTRSRYVRLRLSYHMSYTCTDDITRCSVQYGTVGTVEEFHGRKLPRALRDEFMNKGTVTEIGEERPHNLGWLTLRRCPIRSDWSRELPVRKYALPGDTQLALGVAYHRRTYQQISTADISVEGLR